jgi:Na+/melibiose symporter-like transporter
LKLTPSEFSRCTTKTTKEQTDIAIGKQQAKPKSWLNRTVCGAGLTSALGDFCYETTTVILPGFLAVLGIPAAALGIIEGIADAVASFTKMISGYIADKLGRRKLLVVVGYGLTPIGQALIATASAWPVLLGTVNGTSKFVSSTVVGVLWTVVSPAFGFGLAAFLMAIGTVALLRVGK